MALYRVYIDMTHHLQVAPDQVADGIDTETIDALQSISVRLGTADQRVREAYAAGYVDGLSDVHAWNTDGSQGRKRTIWRCFCGFSVEQLPGSALPRALWDHPSRYQEDRRPRLTVVQ